ncbi:methylated-DNA--[protein]-cysteine S-methyltransferase [Siminovitchia sp. FSL H7-0308]|uniref:Methylated-DNA--protein-cysteine methyltransferase n=1 Tax=Siminovitchia thermophila TaxID=1245522 RepID=A0ABS2RCB2_9BACI|nr:methylated-DNA--[protein]-cysteine S-methyltransferase [Siminovitchia thermophila]MBM7716985.1 methylated-DNA-[protein]-cysteine S-methyltransferase [Siminovitchia thermophila]
MYYTTMDSPIGQLVITGTDEAVTGITFGWDKFLQTATKPVENAEHSILKEAERQLDQYFKGTIQLFNVPLFLHGTSFQKMVWSKLLEIPYGQTRTYGEIAKWIGNEQAVRAVGQANRRNPIPIIIPCHRVVGKNKSLMGYAGNQVDKKEILLKLEGVL